jgi:hypothetical protein
MWGSVGFLFNRVLRSRVRGWWMTYNYVLSAALDSGLAIATVLIFISLQLWSKDMPSWAGTLVVNSTLVSLTIPHRLYHLTMQSG